MREVLAPIQGNPNPLIDICLEQCDLLTPARRECCSSAGRDADCPFAAESARRIAGHQGAVPRNGSVARRVLETSAEERQERIPDSHSRKPRKLHRVFVYRKSDASSSR